MHEIKFSIPIQKTIVVLDGKWKVLILWSVKTKPKRFSDIKADVSGITQKMLSQSLKELTAHGLLTRKSYPEIPPRVEYKLTELGKSLMPILELMHRWGDGQNISSSTHKPQLDLFTNL